MEENGEDRRVHTARERAEHTLAPHLLADLPDVLLDEGAHGPVGAATADPEEEVLDEGDAVDRVVHLGVELHAVELAPGVFHDGNGTVHRRAGNGESPGKLRDPVAVAHPDPLAALQAREQQGMFARVVELKLCGPVFPKRRGGNLPAQRVGHELCAVADPEDGNAQLENPCIALRNPLVEDAGGAPRENDSLHLPSLEPGRRDVVVEDLAVHAALPYAPSDELVVLGAEIQNGDHAGQPSFLGSSVLRILVAMNSTDSPSRISMGISPR